MHDKRGSRATKQLQERRESRTPGRWWAALLTVFLVGLAWRVAFLGRLFAGPLGDHLQGDEHIYWDWSSSLLEHGFRASNPFFLGPLYPYCLALIRLVVGSHTARIAVAQSLLGCITAVLLTDSARRVSRPSIAFSIGVVIALYEMMVLFDAVILMESLLLFLEALFLWLVSRAAARQSRPAVFATVGCVIGLAAECRATAALLLLPAAWFAAKASNPDRKLIKVRVALVAVAFVVTSLPSVVWNARAAHEFIPFTYNLGYNLYVGNNPRANGGFVAITEGPAQAAVPLGLADGGAEADGREFLRKRRGLELSAGRGSAYWAAQAARFVRQHPQQAGALLVKKGLLLLNRGEVSQIESAEMYRRLAGPLGMPFLGSFMFLGPLGIVGAAYAGRGGLYGRFLRLCLLMAIFGILPFFVTDRYRVHLVPALAVLAAFALERFLTWWRTQSWKDLRNVSLVWAGATVVTALPVRGDDARREEWTNWRDVGTRWAEHGEPVRAVEAFEQALRVERASGFDRDSDAAVAQGRALLAFNYGVALHHLGREGEALQWFDAAVRDEPTDARYVRTLADAYRGAGREGVADSLFRRLGTLVGGEPQALIVQGWQAMRDGQGATAESLFTLAVQMDENQYGAWMALIRVQVERGELTAAKRTLDSASLLRVPAPMFWAHTALVAAAMGDSAGARAALGRIPPSSVTGNRLLEGVVSQATGLLGRTRQ